MTPFVRYCISVLIVIVILAGAALLSAARSRDLGQWQYSSPDMAQYFNTLMQPDIPGVSCCGDADAYWADKTDFDERGNLIAIITDTRPNAPLKRTPVEVGTRVMVPSYKRRKEAIPNPTGHTLIFLKVGMDANGNPAYHVYCYEPLPGIQLYNAPQAAPMIRDMMCVGEGSVGLSAPLP